MSNQTVVEAFFGYWQAQDVEMALSLASDDVVYNLYLSNASVPHGGETRGREKCREVLYMVLAEFDYLAYEPTVLGEDGNTVRSQVHFRYHHRRTGGLLSGTKRMVFTVANGLITQVDEHHDAGLVEAFMRLTQQREASNQLVAPPEVPGRRIRAATAPRDGEEPA